MSRILTGDHPTLLRALPTALVAIVLIAVVWLLIYSRQTIVASPEAHRALDPDESMRVIREDWISFRPRDLEPDIGVIFYPGGKAEPAGYAPVLRQLAATGMLVVLVPMPLNLAMFAPDRGAEVMRRHAGVRHWFIAGHSFGGVMAARFARERQQALAGLILWAAFPERSVNLADSVLPVLSVYGIRDQLTEPAEIAATRGALPGNATLLALEGADHWTFGHFAIAGRKSDQSHTRLQAELLAATGQFILATTGKTGQDNDL